ncbi:uncharacterized protein NEMAJ01_1334 [Nematocida major]|uniref:uncharacterized protein n=1 Tax=Nematocida major TaxID=1912982 RepID=UPI00200854F6|nr:uncharacterized protein NEMAJ01_1334 [Nematocida major]KAH9386438.1 hypothetical protein NEMAJ01_1334 [Nematocida major]
MAKKEKAFGSAEGSARKKKSESPSPYQAIDWAGVVAGKTTVCAHRGKIQANAKALIEELGKSVGQGVPEDLSLLLAPLLSGYLEHSAQPSAHVPAEGAHGERGHCRKKHKADALRSNIKKKYIRRAFEAASAKIMEEMQLGQREECAAGEPVAIPIVLSSLSEVPRIRKEYIEEAPMKLRSRIYREGISKKVGRNAGGPNR